MKKDKEETGLLKAGSIFLAGSFIAAVLNYLYHLFMGRMLGPTEYGILGSIFALVYIATTGTGAFNLVISKFTAEFMGKQEEPHIKYLIKKSLKKIFSYGLILLAIYLILTPFIADFMKLDSITGLIIAGAIAFFSLVLTVLSGALNGFQKFIWQNISSIVSVTIKFSFAVILVYLGFGVNGALSSIFLGILFGIFIASIPLTKIFKKTKTEAFDPKRFYFHILPIFIGFMLPIFLITLDQILVKHFFASKEAGFYAAAGNIAKIIWFGSGFLVGPLFPKIVSLKCRNKDPSYLLRKAITYTAILAFLGVLVFLIMPTFVVNMLYGPSYLEVAPIIWIFGIALGLYSINNIFVIYSIATEKYKFIPVLILALAAEITGIFIFHSSLTDVIKILFASNLLITISFMIINRKELGLNGLGSNGLDGFNQNSSASSITPLIIPLFFSFSKSYKSKKSNKLDKSDNKTYLIIENEK